MKKQHRSNAPAKSGSFGAKSRPFGKPGSQSGSKPSFGKSFRGKSSRNPDAASGYRPERSSLDQREFESRNTDSRAPANRNFKKRAFEKRDYEKPRYEKKTFEKKPFEKRERRSRDDAPRSFVKRNSEKHDFEKPSHEKKPFEKRPFQKRDFKKDRPERKRFEKPVFAKMERGEQADHRDRHDKNDRSNRDTVLIWGFHAVRAAWLNPERKCFRLWLSENGQKTFEETLTLAKENLLKRPDVKTSDRAEMDRLTPPGSVHQGIVLEVAPLAEPSLQSLIGGDNPPDCLVMLDQVTDPHNIGAILRSAAALGAGGVILTERNAPSMTGVLAKSASGAADHVPQVHVVNLSRALDELREAGYWSVGLAEEGDKDLAECDLSGRTVIVLGAEGEGLRQLTRKKCDQLARLPTGGPIRSLNVSNAAAVALYEAKRQKKA